MAATRHDTTRRRHAAPTAPTATDGRLHVSAARAGLDLLQRRVAPARNRTARRRHTSTATTTPAAPAAPAGRGTATPTAAGGSGRESRRGACRGTAGDQA